MTSTEAQNLLGFDEADLGANRLGQLTERQRKILAGEHKSQQSVFVGVGIAVAFIFCCLPVLAFGGRALPQILSNQPSFDLTNALPVIAMGGGSVLFAALIIGGVVIFYILRSRRKADITVKQARGPVNYVWETKRVRVTGSSVRSFEDVRVLIMRVGPERRFEVKEPFQDVFKEGEEWAIYYTSYPFKFLSAEQVSKLQ